MPPPRPVLIEQDESHELKLSVLAWLQQAGPAHVCDEDIGQCPFCQRGHRQWTIHDLLLHAHAIAISPAWPWDTRARHRALEEYLLQDARFAALHAATGLP